jgi:hypothetical protein
MSLDLWPSDVYGEGSPPDDIDTICEAIHDATKGFGTNEKYVTTDEKKSFSIFIFIFCSFSFSFSVNIIGLFFFFLSPFQKFKILLVLKLLNKIEHCYMH